MAADRKMTVFHEGNVRLEAEDGTLIDYDPSLKAEDEIEGYAYTNTAGDMKVHVPEGLGEESPLLIGDEEYQIGCSLSEESIEELSLEEAEPVLEEETVPGIYEEEVRLPVDAVYDDPEFSASLSYTSCDHGVKETMVLKEMPQTNVFHLSVSGGIPRMINRICKKTLMYAYKQQKRMIDGHMVRYVGDHEMVREELVSM